MTVVAGFSPALVVAHDQDDVGSLFPAVSIAGNGTVRLLLCHGGLTEEKDAWNPVFHDMLKLGQYVFAIGIQPRNPQRTFSIA